MSRLFAIGDVHGYLKPLETLIEHINPQRNDTLIFLGDVIDRGEDSKGVIDLIIDLQSQCKVHCIQGNHEEMCLRSVYDPQVRASWLYYGGSEMLQSFGLSATKIGLAQLPEKYIEFMQNMLPYVETEAFIFTHATPFEHLPMAQQPPQGLRWERPDFSRPYQHISTKPVICGHTPQASGEPWAEKGLMIIDTHVAQQWLTALDMVDFTAHQANRSGDYRFDKRILF